MLVPLCSDLKYLILLIPLTNVTKLSPEKFNWRSPGLIALCLETLPQIPRYSRDSFPSPYRMKWRFNIPVGPYGTVCGVSLNFLTSPTILQYSLDFFGVGLFWTCFTLQHSSSFGQYSVALLTISCTSWGTIIQCSEHCSAILCAI